jgi:hypothetical protein
MVYNQIADIGNSIISGANQQNPPSVLVGSLAIVVDYSQNPDNLALQNFASKLGDIWEYGKIPFKDIDVVRLPGFTKEQVSDFTDSIIPDVLGKDFSPDEQFSVDGEYDTLEQISRNALFFNKYSNKEGFNLFVASPEHVGIWSMLNLYKDWGDKFNKYGALLYDMVQTKTFDSDKVDLEAKTKFLEEYPQDEFKFVESALQHWAYTRKARNIIGKVLHTEENIKTLINDISEININDTSELDECLMSVPILSELYYNFLLESTQGDYFSPNDIIEFGKNIFYMNKLIPKLVEELKE